LEYLNYEPDDWHSLSPWVRCSCGDSWVCQECYSASRLDRTKLCESCDGERQFECNFEDFDEDYNFSDDDDEDDDHNVDKVNNTSNSNLIDPNPEFLTESELQRWNFDTVVWFGTGVLEETGINPQSILGRVIIHILKVVQVPPLQFFECLDRVIDESQVQLLNTVLFPPSLETLLESLTHDLLHTDPLHGIFLEVIQFLTALIVGSCRRVLGYA
jgi:hypothetical protein